MTQPVVPCPSCGGVSKVLPTRSKTIGATHEDGQRIYRRMRECDDCETRFTSVERFERIVQKSQDVAR